MADGINGGDDVEPMADDPFPIADHQASDEGRRMQRAQIVLGHLGRMGEGVDADDGGDGRIARGLEQGRTGADRVAMRAARRG